MILYKKIKNSSKYRYYSRKLKVLIANNLYNNKKYLPHGIDRVYHYHIRKSAGTSINAAFWHLDNLTLQSIGKQSVILGRKRSYVRINLNYIENVNFFYANSHFPMWQVHLPDNTFTFTVLRDPYERLVSLYKYYKWVEITDYKIGEELDPSFNYLKSQKYLQNKSFGEFIDILSKKYLFGNLYMFSERLDVDEAMKNLSKVNKVYFQDNVSFAVEDLKKSLSLKELELPKPQRKFNNNNFEITQIEKEKAISVLKCEIEFYIRARKKYSVV